MSLPLFIVLWLCVVRLWFVALLVSKAKSTSMGFLDVTLELLTDDLPEHVLIGMLFWLAAGALVLAELTHGESTRMVTLL